MAKKNVIIIGAAGRDFHNFNTYFRNNADYNVVAFTAAQIPDIEDRKYPAALAGDLYPDGIPIHAEEALTKLIKELNVDFACFAPKLIICALKLIMFALKLIIFARKH